MDAITTGLKYDKVADWWHRRHKTSIYGLDQVNRAINYCTAKQRALDVGCGSGGRIIKELEKHKFDIVGIDVSRKMVDIASTQHPNVQFINADITNWHTDCTFDLIIAWDSIFHLPSEEQELVLQKLCSFLSPNGILVYTFGDGVGDHEDLSFSDGKGGQYGDLEEDLFGYGTIGINENLNVLMKNDCKVMHLELDQYPEGHVYVIAKKCN